MIFFSKKRPPVSNCSFYFGAARRWCPQVVSWFVIAKKCVDIMSHVYIYIHIIFPYFTPQLYIYIQLLGISVYSRNFLRTFFMGTKPPSTGWCFPVMRTLLCKAHEYHMVIVDINYVYSR